MYVVDDVPHAPAEPQVRAPTPPPPAPAPVKARAPRAPKPPKGTIEPTRRSERAPKPPTQWWVVPPSSTASDDAPASEADASESVPPVDEDMDDVQFAGAASTSDPANYKQAMKADDAERWREAALAEYNTLLANGTWELVDLPPGEKVIGLTWVFHIKRHSDSSIECYKARIVAQGFSQRPGRDYLKVHAPTPRPATL